MVVRDIYHVEPELVIRLCDGIGGIKAGITDDLTGFSADKSFLIQVGYIRRGDSIGDIFIHGKEIVIRGVQIGIIRSDTLLRRRAFERIIKNGGVYKVVRTGKEAHPRIGGRRRYFLG